MNTIVINRLDISRRDAEVSMMSQLNMLNYIAKKKAVAKKTISPHAIRRRKARHFIKTQWPYILALVAAVLLSILISRF